MKILMTIFLQIKDILVSKFSKDVLSNICLFMAGLLYLVFCFNVLLHVLSILNRCIAPMNLAINLFLSIKLFIYTNLYTEKFSWILSHKHIRTTIHTNLRGFEELYLKVPNILTNELSFGSVCFIFSKFLSNIPFRAGSEHQNWIAEMPFYHRTKWFRLG